MIFEGVYTAIITPFQDQGRSVDYGAYRELIERQAASGAAGVVPCGTTGESPTLSHQEHQELIARTVEYVNGRMKVIAGAGSNSTSEAEKLTIAACKDGADAVMLVNPYYNKPSQEGLYRHFKTVAEASSAPVVLYNIKGRTAVNTEPETLSRLADIENIQAVKEASGDLGQMVRIKKLCGSRLTILSGDDNIIPAVMGIGGRGVISVASNLFPTKMTRMMHHYLQGDFAAGNEIFYELTDLMNALFWDTNPVPVKAAMHLMKHCGGDLRLPLVAMAPEKVAAMKKIIDGLGADD